MEMAWSLSTNTGLWSISSGMFQMEGKDSGRRGELSLWLWMEDQKAHLWGALRAWRSRTGEVWCSLSCGPGMRPRGAVKQQLRQGLTHPSVGCETSWLVPRKATGVQHVSNEANLYGGGGCRLGGPHKPSPAGVRGGGWGWLVSPSTVPILAMTSKMRGQSKLSRVGLHEHQTGCLGLRARRVWAEVRAAGWPLPAT